MATTDDATGFNAACAEFVHSAVSTIPSLLERLIFLTSLREPDRGEYNDRVLEALLALKFGKAETDPVRRYGWLIGVQCRRAEIDRVLRHEHRVVFEDWLCLNLQQQTAELDGYASSQCTPSIELFSRESYEGLIPSDAMPFQRRLFLADMATGLAALRMRVFGKEAP